jgi:hypothetical protein
MSQPAIDSRTQSEVDPAVYAAYVKTFVNPAPSFSATGFHVINSIPSWPRGPAFWALVGVPKT